MASPTRTLAVTPRGQLALQLARLERAADQLTDAELLDLAAALEPLARLARIKADYRRAVEARAIV